MRRRRFGDRAGEAGVPPLSPLMVGARAAQAWMEMGITDRPEPLHAVFARAGLAARGAAGAGTIFALVGAAGQLGHDLPAPGGGKRADGAARTRPAGRSGEAGEGQVGPRATNARASPMPSTRCCARPASPLKAFAAGARIAAQTATAPLRELEGRDLLVK